MKSVLSTATDAITVVTDAYFELVFETYPAFDHESTHGDCFPGGEQAAPQM